MDKVQKIREEVERIQLYTQSKVLKQILDYIDEVQKEPVSNPTPNGKMSVERWKKACDAASSDRNYRSHYGLTETRDDYFVDGVQWADEHPKEEPISEKKCMFTKDSYADEDRKVLCEDCKEKCEYSKKEEPVSEVWYNAKKTLPESSTKQIICIKEDGLSVATVGKIVTGTIKWAYLDTLLHISNKNLTESQCRKLIDTAFELGKAANKDKPVSEEQVKESTKNQHVDKTCKENGNSLTQEPVSESIDFEQELYKAFGQIKDFTLGVAIAKRFYDMGRKHNEPISEDLEEAAFDYAEACKYDGGEKLLCIEHFKAGAYWKEQQFEKNRLAHCDAQTEEEAEIEQSFVMDIIEREHRQPTFDDAIKYGMKKMKEQMMKDAVDGWVFRDIKGGKLRISDNKECWNGIRIPEKSIEKSYLFCTTDDAIKVKLVIVNED